MNSKKRNILKGVFYGFSGTVACMVLLGAGLPRTGVNVRTGEPVIIVPGQNNREGVLLPTVQEKPLPDNKSTNKQKKQTVPSKTVESSIGRYQLSSWSTSWGDGGGYGAFVVDTATGRTKIAYSYFFVEQGKESVTVNNLDKSFGRIDP